MPDRRRDDDYSDVVGKLEEIRSERDSATKALLRDALIARCLPLADHIARRFSDRGEPFDDLLQVARIGVVNAVDRFDPDRGGNFLAFAVPTVMGEVRRHFRDSTWSMRVPRRIKETSLAISKASDELVQTLGRAPRPSELAAHLGCGVDEVIEGLTARSAYTPKSIDAETAGEDTDGWSIADRLGEDDERLDQIDDFVALRPAIERLPEREREILTLRFFRSMSQTEIAKRVGISQMHVSRLLSRTLAELREEMTAGSESAGTDVARG